MDRFQSVTVALNCLISTNFTVRFWFCLSGSIRLIDLHWIFRNYHYNDVIMSPMASHITSLTIVHSTVCSGPDRYWPSVRGIHRSPVNSPHKGQWPWWRHQMKTFSALLAICAGNSPPPSPPPPPPPPPRIPSQRPVTRSFDVFCDLCLNKRLSKHS